MLWLVYASLFVVVLSEDEETPSPTCMEDYLSTRDDEPERNYKYFHETLALPKENAISWRIIGGNTISIEQAPYQVSYGRYCGGSLLAPEWVITAAHCKDRYTYVMAGSTFLNNATHYPICAHIFHPLWNSTNKYMAFDYDYQLLLLDRPVPVTSLSRPIAIGSFEDIQPGIMVSITGWGHLTNKNGKMQDILHQVSVPIWNDEVCKNLPTVVYSLITPRFFCAGVLDGSKDSCKGDSGSPVVLDGKLVGLVSFGVGCGQANQPGVYAKIPSAIGWIREVTGLPL